MEIQKTHSTLSTESTTDKVTLKPVISTESKVKKPELSVSVSKDWHLIEENISQLRQMSDVDMAKVSALQESIKQGDFKLDLSLISEKMINQHG